MAVEPPFLAFKGPANFFLQVSFEDESEISKWCEEFLRAKCAKRSSSFRLGVYIAIWMPPHSLRSLRPGTLTALWLLSNGERALAVAIWVPLLGAGRVHLSFLNSVCEDIHKAPIAS